MEERVSRLQPKSFTPGAHGCGGGIRLRLRGAFFRLSPCGDYGWVGQMGSSVRVRMTFEYFEDRRRRAVVKDFGLSCEMR